ncbi:MAG: M13 family metallopeptidase [Bryobacteraceae bacterium]
MSKFRLLIPFTFLALPLAAQSMKSGFDVNAIDKKTDPCVDFYQYACGNWLANNPIPPDQSTWGRFSELHERNQRILKDILETSAAKTNRPAAEVKLGDYYGACMDERGINAKGTSALKPELDRINALSDKAGIAEEVARLQRLGVNALFRTESAQDLRNASEVIAELDQGGLGLPERDYYLKSDAKSGETRKEYVAHLQRIFELLGDSAEVAARKAATVMRIETALAKGSMDIVSRRDPEKLYHRMSTADLAALAPSFAFPKFLVAVGLPAVKTLNITVPEFFKTLEAEIKEVSLDDWKIYLTWHYVHSSAAFLPENFVNENFEFYGKHLTGAKELRARWKRCVSAVDGDLGEALGQKYVDMTFGKEGKERTLKMVHAIEKAMQQDITEITWMTPATKKKALEKLQAVADKIGYPDQWRDYSKLTIRPDDALGNSTRANVFEFERQLDKIGKPVDKKEWQMTPPTVNAYYDPQMNNINFPAGILQPPFYDNKLDDAVNYGGIGAVIGHELTHGFDDQGRQFDAKGDLVDWWTEADGKEFEKRAGCIEKEYGDFVVSGDLKLNGKLTEGENVADNGGLRLAHMALMDVLGGKKPAKIEGLTADQRFFLGFAQIWCTNMRDQAMRLRAQTDPHSLPQYRVNGTVSNMPEFQNAFSCKVGQPMVRQNACRVW